MESSTKKSIKMTTAMQFEQLVACMEDFPHLATGSPQFGSSKASVSCTWDTVARKLNSYGPPSRSGSEWKKVWTDLKCRLKKKIADNNNSLHETGGGPCRVSNLTKLEVDIDRICHISSAAAPSGKSYGCPKNTVVKRDANRKLFDLTPSKRSQNVAVVTPTSSSMVTNIVEEVEILGEKWDSLPTTSNNAAIQPYRMSTATKKTAESQQRKRKYKDSKFSEGQERLKLLREQFEIQCHTLDAIKAQAEQSKECVAAVKECAAAVIECSEAIKTQAASLRAISESMKLMSKSIADILWSICDK